MLPAYVRLVHDEQRPGLSAHLRDPYLPEEEEQLRVAVDELLDAYGAGVTSIVAYVRREREFVIDGRYRAEKRLLVVNVFVGERDPGGLAPSRLLVAQQITDRLAVHYEADWKGTDLYGWVASPGESAALAEARNRLKETRELTVLNLQSLLQRGENIEHVAGAADELEDLSGFRLLPNARRVESQERAGLAKTNAALICVSLCITLAILGSMGAVLKLFVL